MTRIKEYIKDSEVGGEITGGPVRRDIIDMIKQHNTKSPSPSGKAHFDEDIVLKYMNEKKSSDIYVGAKVKVLNGKYKGKVGKVVDYDLEDDQVDVKMPDGKERYLGFNDVKVED